MGENSNECELAYETALWMLFALVDETMQDGTSVRDEDRSTVDKCKSIRSLSLRYCLMVNKLTYSYQIYSRSSDRSPSQD